MRKLTSRDISEANPVIHQLLEWASVRDDVRAVLLTSSLTAPGAQVDVFSDYDVILAVRDVHPYFEDRGWLGDFGPVLVVYRDPLMQYYGLDKFVYVTQYENGLKIDFTLWTGDILPRIAADPVLPPGLDVGYNVLLDKDSLTAGLKPPTYRSFIATPPSREEYLRVIEEFFHELTYVAKHLWRDDLVAAKAMVEYSVKADNLLPMLEWRLGIDENRSVKAGVLGRGLKQRLSAERWAVLESTYVGPGWEENWTAIFKTIVLFQEIAVEVGNHFGYEYPQDLHQRMILYLEKVMRLNRDATAFE
jgi:aminoglycoside 6-adenylyltransferase